MTAMILTGIPFFILFAIYIASPKYLDPLFYTDKGNVLLMVGCALLTLGVGIIFRMSYKEIY